MVGPSRFANRTEAGEQLAEVLDERGIDPDIVLAIPRGGLPLGRAVADELDAPLDIVVAKKVGAPRNPEYAIGAVAVDGSAWRNLEAFRRHGIDEEDFERKSAEKAVEAQEKAERYRDGRARPDVAAKTVVVVDDGVATGSTARACLESLDKSGAGHIVLAVPVGPPESIGELEAIADDVVCLSTPGVFRGVGQFYDDFSQVSDEEAMTYLSDGA